MKLTNVVVILDDQHYAENEKQITAIGGRLKVEKARGGSTFRMAESSFLAYSKTLLYGYAICSLKDTIDPWFTLNGILEYYDTFGQLVIRDMNCGAQQKG